MAKFNNSKRSKETSKVSDKAAATGDKRPDSKVPTRSNGGSGRGRKTKNTDRNKAAAEAPRSATGALSSLNDISWYSRNPDLLMAAGSFPYPYRPGMTVPDVGVSTMVNGSGAVVTGDSDGLQIPGVFGINWAPSLGVSNSVTDPASIVGKELYAKVRSVYSGSLVADPPDFVIYLTALDSVFSYIGWLKRVFRTINAYSPNNFVVPDGVMTAMGFSAAAITELRLNKMGLFSVISELTKMSRKFMCPAVMDMFNRHYWLNDNLYTDAPSANAQFYMFNQTHFYKFAMLDVEGVTPAMKAGGLELIEFTAADKASVSKLFDFGRSLIDALASSEDGYTISGYLMRAYEGVPSFVVEDLSYDETLTPVYVEEVLMQIENATSLPVRASLSTGGVSLKCNVTQNPATNVIVSNPTATIDFGVGGAAPNTMFSGGGILSIRSDAPTVADNVIATRLKALYEKGKVSGSEVDFAINCATEFVTNFTTVKFDGVKFTLYPLGGYIEVNIVASSQDRGFTGVLLALSQFDWHPLMPVGVFDTTHPKPTFHIFGDIHNTTTLSAENLKQINRVCVLSELNAFNY